MKWRDSISCLSHYRQSVTNEYTYSYWKNSKGSLETLLILITLFIYLSVKSLCYHLVLVMGNNFAQVSRPVITWLKWLSWNYWHRDAGCSQLSMERSTERPLHRSSRLSAEKRQPHYRKPSPSPLFPTFGFWSEARDCPELISGSHWPLSFVTSRSWWELMIGHADFIVWGGSGDPGKISRNPSALALVSSWILWTLPWPHHARGKRLSWVTVKGKGGLSRHWDNVPSRGPLGLWPKETANKLVRLLGSQLPLPSQQSPARAWN